MAQHVDVGLSTRLRIPEAGEVPQMGDDGYPAIFLDQRHMLRNGLFCETAEDVFWKCWVPWLAEKQNIEPRADDREVVPYLNAGRWIADCPACRGSMPCWDRNPYACCLNLGCGRIFKVLWQLPWLRSEVCRLLAGRVGCICHPEDPYAHLNWDAHKGETVEELKLQNVGIANVAAVERNALLVAENVNMPDEFTSVAEYLDRLRRQRKVG